MPDKCLERFYLDQLFVALQLAPEQDPEDGESPDFLVRAGGRTVGVELTMFHLPPKPGAKPGRELAALQDRAVEYARRKFREAGGPALYVKRRFHGPWPTQQAPRVRTRPTPRGPGFGR